MYVNSSVLRFLYFMDFKVEVRQHFKYTKGQDNWIVTEAQRIIDK